MDYEEFALETEEKFRNEVPGLLVKNENGLLVIKDKENNEKEYPTVDIKSLFSNLKDENPEEVILELIKRYCKKAGIEKDTYKKIIFICKNKEKSNSGCEVYEIKDNIKLVYCIDNNDNMVELLSKQLLIDNNIDKDELFKTAVSNMRKKYPCKIVSLEEFSKNHDVNISADDAENIYVLCCEKEDFLYSSAGLYYSADKIKQFSRDKGCDVYILPVTGSETYLCTSDIFSKKDITEVMENYSHEDKDFLTNEALVFSGGKLINLKDYKERTATVKKKNKKI